MGDIMDEFVVLGTLSEKINQYVEEGLDKYFRSHNMNHYLFYPLIAIEIGVLQKAPEDIDNLFRRCIAGFLYSKAVKSGIKITKGKINISGLKKYVKDNDIRVKSDVLTGHIARPHTAQDIEIYKRTIDMWFENKQHERLKYDDLPEDLKTHKNRTSFVDRFKVVEGDMDHCHTILAHLSKDGHYSFIQI